MKHKRISAISLLLCIVMFAATLGGVSVAAEETSSGLRREISSDNPLFIVNLYSGSKPENLQYLWDSLPEDVRPYFGVQLIPEHPIKDTSLNRTFIESMLAKAQELNFPAMIQTESFNTNSNIPQSYYASLFDQYSALIGLVNAELSASNLTIFGISAQQVTNLKENIETAASKGGYFMWQDMGYEIEHVFAKAGSDSGLYQTITQNKENVILVDKHNGRSKRFVGPAAAMGFWLSDLVGNWGVNSEDWLWWEAGFGHLYAEAGANRSQNDWKSVFSFPDSQFGIDWLADMAGGATVYSLECPYHGFTTHECDLTTPAFDQVILPLIRQMLGKNLIPDRSEVLEEVKVAHQLAESNPGELQNDELFAGVYGPSGKDSARYEWTPSTGRYAYLPILPVRAGETEQSLFNGITKTETYNRLFPSYYDKIKRFNQDYPASATGDSWVMSYGGHHFLANPNENKDITSYFEIPLAINPKATIAGSFSPHTLGVIDETDGLSIHLSNYRIDSEADVWNNPNFNSADIPGYVRNQYIANPSDDTLRQSVVALKGVTASEPEYTVTGNNNFSYTADWNGELEELTLTILHNGPVDIQVTSQLDGEGTVNRNLAPYASVTASSQYDARYYLDELAIDGSPNTRWNAAKSDKSGAWLSLDFEALQTIDRVVIREHENRVSGYKLQVWSGSEWTDIWTGTTIGEKQEVTFDPVTTQKIRLLITGVNAEGNEATISEFEVYQSQEIVDPAIRDENLALGGTTTASSVYDSAYPASNATDGTSMSFWNAADKTVGGEWLEVDFGTEVTFNKVVTCALLDRITSYTLQYWDGAAWMDIQSGTKVYPSACDIFAPVTAQKLRIFINSTKTDQFGWGTSAAIEELQVYYDAIAATIIDGTADSAETVTSEAVNGEVS